MNLVRKWGDIVKKLILSIFSVFTILIGGYFLLNLDSVNSSAQIKDQKIAEHNNKKTSLTKNIYAMSDEELYKEFGDLSEEQLKERFLEFKDSDKIVVLSAGGQLTGNGESELVDYKENHRQVINASTDSNAVSVKDLKELLISKRDNLRQIKETNSVELE